VGTKSWSNLITLLLHFCSQCGVCEKAGPVVRPFSFSRLAKALFSAIAFIHPFRPFASPVYGVGQVCGWKGVRKTSKAIGEVAFRSAVIRVPGYLGRGLVLFEPLECFSAAIYRVKAGCSSLDSTLLASIMRALLKLNFEF